MRSVCLGNEKPQLICWFSVDFEVGVVLWACLPFKSHRLTKYCVVFIVFVVFIV